MLRQTALDPSSVYSRRDFLQSAASLGAVGIAAILTPNHRLGGTALAQVSAVTPPDLPPNTWVSRPVPPFPASPGPVYSKHIRLTYDSDRHLVYFWGGDYCVPSDVYGSRCASHEEFWSYDIALDKWQLLLNQRDAIMAGYPRGRCVPGFVYDPKRKVVWMTGGQERFQSYDRSLLSGGLWAFDPALQVWSREGPDPTFESTKVDDIEVNCMVYDLFTDSLYIPGANAKNLLFSLADVTLRDGVAQDNWSSNPFPKDDPRVARGNNNVFAVDTRRNRVILYLPYYGETWAYNFVTREATRLNEQKLPMVANFTMVYDSVNDLVVLWGGGTHFDPNLRDLWVFNPQTNQWSKPVISGDPTGAVHAQMAFDPFNNAIVLYGEKIHLLRLNLDGTPVDTIPPAAPTNLQVQ